MVASLSAGAIISLSLEPVSWVIGWLLSSGLIFLSLLILKAITKFSGNSKTMIWMVGIAFILRLGIGVGLMKALPTLGFPTDQQKAGYVFFDAYRRDTQAINLVNKSTLIIKTFTDKFVTDQYGGMLATSMLVYRYISGGVHRPFLILILSAFFGTLAIPFFVMSARRIFANSESNLAGWIFALFPQAVILGASQMREPFLICFIAISFWALSEWIEMRDKTHIWVFLGGVAGMLLFSPGVLLPFIIFSGGWMYFKRHQISISKWVWISAVVIILIGLIAFSFGVSQQEKLAGGSPFAILFTWFKGVVSWDAYTSAKASGRLEFIFASLPQVFQLPFIIVYGIFQPVLPAALLDTTVGIWRTISSTLAIGWYLVLPVLIYTVSMVIFSKKLENKSLIAWTSVFFWVWIILCSARAGGDQWDNPRYRVIFIFCMAILCVWGWQHAKTQNSRWLKRIYLVEAISILMFVQWYASRYYQLVFRFPFFVMLTIIIGLSAIIILSGWYFDHRKKIGP